MTRTRVVVTGMGLTSPVGGDVPSTWEALLAGRSGIRRLTEEWAEEMPVKIAGRVAVEPTEVLERVKARRLDRSSQFAMVAAMEAWRDAGLEGAELESERVGVALASGIGGVTTLLDNYDVLKAKGPRRVSPLAVPMLMPNAPGREHQPATSAPAARSTPRSRPAPRATRASRWRIDQIRLGRADVVVAGGTEAAIHPLPMAAFANMMALSKTGSERAATPPRTSRPWDTGARRLRARRGRRRPGARVRGARPRPRRPHLRRGARRRHHRRRPRHRPARPVGSRWRPGDPPGARRGRARPGPTSCTSTPTPPRRRRATSPRA